MPAKRSKPPVESIPFSLTEKQREALIQATRLKRSIKTRLEQAASGTRSIEFTNQELIHLENEAQEGLWYAPQPQKRRLDAVLDKLSALLDALEERDLKARRRKNPASGDIYQLKVTLKGSKPAIWRRIQVPDGTLGELHDILQVAMGWDDSHLHQFIVGGEYYGVPADDDDFFMSEETRDEEDILISQIAKKGGKARFTYEYDFGDSWEHEIVVEKALEPGTDIKYPRCVGGARACPPEDCGGIWGYSDFVAAMADPNHENHENVTEWFAGEFDPEAFDAEAVNKQLGSG